MFIGFPLVCSCTALFFGLCIAAVLGSDAVAALSLWTSAARIFSLQLVLFSFTTEEVGTFWKLQLLPPEQRYCDHNHLDVCDSWILVDRAGSWAGSWAAVLCHIYCHVSGIL